MPPFADRVPHPRGLPDPAPARYVVFSDFDETYLAHAPSPAQRQALARLEEFLLREAGSRHLLFGWVTGSSAEAVVAKARRHGLTAWPHFIASSLATDLTVLDGGGLRPDTEWARRVRASGYSPASVRRVVEALDARGVALARQPSSGATAFVENYYLRDGGPDGLAAVGLVRALAAEHGLGVNVSPCNPGAGDPAGWYDVDFYPSVCGKAGVVRYLCDRFGIPADRAFAFGDSGGDLEMLAAVGHGVLVGNCTADARRAFGRACERTYADAILQTLRDVGGAGQH